MVRVVTGFSKIQPERSCKGASLASGARKPTLAVHVGATGRPKQAGPVLDSPATAPVVRNVPVVQANNAAVENWQLAVGDCAGNRFAFRVRVIQSGAAQPQVEGRFSSAQRARSCSNTVQPGVITRKSGSLARAPSAL